MENSDFNREQFQLCLACAILCLVGVVLSFVDSVLYPALQRPIDSIWSSLMAFAAGVNIGQCVQLWKRGHRKEVDSNGK